MPDPTAFSPKHLPLWLTGGALLLGLILSAQTVRDLYRLYSEPAAGRTGTVEAIPRPLPPTDEPGTPAQSDARMDPGPRIAARHLFGNAGQTGAPPAGRKAPPTRLNLKLRGVLALGNGKGVALIVGSGRGEQVYAPGDEILSGVRLQAVHADHVILVRNGVEERLDLPKGPPAFSLAESAPGLAGGSSPPPARALRQLRRQAVANPSRLGQLIRIAPARRDGKLIGYRIDPRGNQPLFGQLGFQPGDVVIAVNGTRLDDPRKNLKVMRDLMQARRFDITILRDGQELQISQSLE